MIVIKIPLFSFTCWFFPSRSRQKSNNIFIFIFSKKTYVVFFCFPTSKQTIQLIVISISHIREMNRNFDSHIYAKWILVRCVMNHWWFVWVSSTIFLTLFSFSLSLSFTFLFPSINSMNYTNWIRWNQQIDHIQFDLVWEICAYTYFNPETLRILEYNQCESKLNLQYNCSKWFAKIRCPK